MDEKENTGTESSAVTAIKVKVVIDTNKKELDQQFNSVKEHYKEKPVKIAFGVNQNDTIRNINDALDKVVKSGKLKTPKVTLDVKIDQSKVTAQLKKAMQSAAKQTVKVDTGKSDHFQFVNDFSAFITLLIYFSALINLYFKPF